MPSISDSMKEIRLFIDYLKYSCASLIILIRTDSMIKFPNMLTVLI